MGGQSPIISEVQFKHNPELVNQYGDYKTYLAAQEKELKTTSSWDLYYKGKAEYILATERFDEAKAIFSFNSNKKNKAEAKYNQMLAVLQEQRGEDGKISLTDRASLASKSGYTTDLIRTCSDAEIDMNIALDARFNAVDTQRRGLYFNG